MADGKVIIDTGLDLTGITQGAHTLKNMLTGGIVYKSVQTLKNIVKDLAGEAENLNATIRKAQTLFGNVNVDIDGLTKKITNLSNATGMGAESIGSALYDALSAGIPVTEDMGEAMAFLEKTIKTAKGGFADLNTAVTATASVLNAYGMSVEETDRVQGILLQTQNLGITTVAELGSTLAQVVPTASAFGVSFEQVGAALATMTASGTKTAQATTSLNALLNELGKQSQQGAKNLKEAASSAGLSATSFEDLFEQGYNLSEVLQIMQDYAEQNGKSLVDMFGSVEAGRAALQLASNDGEKFNTTLEKMGDTAGLVDSAFETVTSDYEKLNTAIKNLKAAIGQSLTPALTTMATKATEVLISLTDQKSASEQLETALKNVKTATEDYQKAQEDAKGATDETSESMRTQAAALLKKSYSEFGKIYREAQQDINKYGGTNYLGSAETLLRGRQKSLEDWLAKKNMTREQADEALSKGLLSNGDEGRYIELVRNLTAAQEHYDGYADKVNDAKEAQKNLVEAVAKGVREGDLDLTMVKANNKALGEQVQAYNKVYNAMQPFYEKGKEQGSSTVLAIFSPDEEGNAISAEKALETFNKQLEVAKSNMDKFDEGTESYAKWKGIYDGMTEGLQNYTKAQEEANKKSSGSAGVSDSSEDKEKANAIQEVIDKTNEELDLEIRKRQVYGDSYDINTQKANIFKNAINDLLALGVGIDNETIQNYAQIVKNIDNDWTLPESIKETGEAAFDADQRIQEMTDALTLNHNLAIALGDDYDENANAIRIYEAAIQDLIANGVNPASKQIEFFRQMIRKLKGETKETAEATETFNQLMNRYFSEANVKDRMTKGLSSSVKAFANEIDFFGDKVKEMDEEIRTAEDDLSGMENELADARARNDQGEITALEEKIAAQNKLIEVKKKEKREVETGANAWKAMGKAALNALAETLTGLGAELAAHAAIKAMSLQWGQAATAAAASVAAFSAGAMVSAAAGRFAEGGLVPRRTGSSAQGDQQVAYVNAGELILNMAQQRNLADQINALAQRGANSEQTIHIQIDTVNGLDSQDVGLAVYRNIRQLQSEGVI